MPVLSYQVNSPGQGGVNPKITYIFTNDPVAVVTQTGYIDWLANPQGIYPGDVALVVTRETPTSTLGAGFFEFVRVGTGPHWNLVPQAGSETVDSVTGTLNQIIASPTIGDVIISIDTDPQLPGTGSVGLPKGNTAQQAGIVGSIRFNTQTGFFEGTADGSTWVAFATGGSGGVTSLSGTANQIVVSAPTGSVIISIDPDPILPGSAAVTLPSGNIGARGNIAGSLRFNTQINAIELTNNGTNWYTVLDTNNGVSSVSGTANRITVTGTNMAVVDIASNYAGQNTISIVGTVVTGIWNASTVTVPFGGTGGTSFTAFAPLCGNGTSSFLPASSGQSNVGYVLKSTGSGSLPTWQVESALAGEGAKFWINAAGSGSSIFGSFGVSSITDIGAGNLGVNFTTPFSGSYCIQVSVFLSTNGFTNAVTFSNATSCNVLNQNTGGAHTDPGIWYVNGFGPQ